jgi:hypothetical protein
MFDPTMEDQPPVPTVTKVDKSTAEDAATIFDAATTRLHVQTCKKAAKTH